MPRLFTGLEIPSDTALPLSRQRGGLSGAHWIDPQNYHITLRFIGDVDMQIAREVTDALRSIPTPQNIATRITHLDFFGGKKPRSLYTGLEPNSDIANLYAAQERIFQRISLPPDSRKFTPHVTLARLRGTRPSDLAKFMSNSMWFAPLVFNVHHFTLYSSRNSKGGGPYIVEKTYDF